jgi:hypothetical protein
VRRILAAAARIVGCGSRSGLRDSEASRGAGRAHSAPRRRRARGRNKAGRPRPCAASCGASWRRVGAARRPAEARASDDRLRRARGSSAASAAAARAIDARRRGPRGETGAVCQACVRRAGRRQRLALDAVTDRCDGYATRETLQVAWKQHRSHITEWHALQRRAEAIRGKRASSGNNVHDGTRCRQG